MITQKREIIRTDNIITVYELPNGQLHRTDGPASVQKYNNGRIIELWYQNGFKHRYGGPAFVDHVGITAYYINGNFYSQTITDWLKENEYDWFTMSEQEKWELDLFMRSL